MESIIHKCIDQSAGMCSLGSYMIIALTHCFTKSNFSKNSFRNTIRVSDSLDPDLARHFVGPDLGPKLFAMNIRRWHYRSRQRVNRNSSKDIAPIWANKLKDSPPNFISWTTSWESLLTVCMLVNFSCFCCQLRSPTDCFSKHYFRNTIRAPNDVDPWSNLFAKVISGRQKWLLSKERVNVVSSLFMTQLVSASVNLSSC